MLQIARHIIIGLLEISFFLMIVPVYAEQPNLEEVFGVLGMAQEQIAELGQGRPVAFPLNEERDDELAVGIALYLPVSLEKVTKHLQRATPDSLDVDVTAHGLLTEKSGSNSLAAVVLSEQIARDLLEAQSGDEFNLSAQEIESFKTLKKQLDQTHDKPIAVKVGQHYREILFQRFKAYRHGGTNAIAPYARQQNQDSKPAMELLQAANSSEILTRYFQDIRNTWLDYPQPLPSGAVEAFPWVEKKVESRSAVILRHRIQLDWRGGVLVLTREFYAPHSFNASQWITGCLPYRNGTMVFQQVRSYTDQVAGVASAIKHVVGRKLLKDKMLKSFERLCGVFGQCR